jgi:NitT/TauT family transport system permease protein
MSTQVMSGQALAFGWIGKLLGGRSFSRAVIALVVFLLLWEIGSRSEQWAGFRFPWIGIVPPPTDVFVAWGTVIGDFSYWESWKQSFQRVLSGFFAAIIVGVPLGLALATNRTFYRMVFPVFEVLRPIPPLAWVPAAIIFWPTQEMAIAFVTFLGAFYTIVINVVGGAKNIDVRYFQSAKAMGSSDWDIFRRIILPGVLPSIFTGAAVGMGITWEVVVAAEMISGGGSQVGGTAGGGLGFFIWNSYLGGSYELIVVGMISIGIAGYICSSAIRWAGKFATPWTRLR